MLAGCSAAHAGPAGAASGYSRVLALGDSVTSGSSCDCTAFPQLVADELARREGRPVSVINEGIDGLTAADLVELISSDDGGDVRGAIADADLVVLTIGANDVVADPSAQAPTAQAVGSALTMIGHLAPTARVAVTTYWNVDADGAAAVPDAAERARSDALTRAFNADLTAVARAHGATLVDLYAPFKGDGSRDPGPLLLEDGDHPDAAGHQVIAAAIVTAVT